EVQVHIDETPKLPGVRGDPHRLTQVLLNLITNARQATAASGHPGLVRVRIETIPAAASRLRATASGRVVQLAVTDQGPGVPAELEDRIFDAFVTSKAEGEGTGLGLSISRGIVEDMGGCLYLDAAHAPGARFVVELPALGDDVAVEDAAEP